MTATDRIEMKPSTPTKTHRSDSNLDGTGRPDVSERVPVSVCLLAKDEEEELPRCLDAIAWADEIIVVVDDRSQDDTERIARARASHVERRTYAGDVAQKEYCVGLARHDWVLILDPDEVIPETLAESIRRAVSAGTARAAGEASEHGGVGPVAYRLNRVTYHLGRWIRHGDFFPDWKLRLFRRSKARFVGRDPHGRVEVEGPIGDLEGELEHYSYRDLADQVARIEFFSGQAASALIADGVPFRLRDLVLRPPARFLRSYFLKQGFRDGLPGFVIAGASAFYVFLKYARLWEGRKLGVEKGAGARARAQASMTSGPGEADD